ncbi:hypothetical protein GURASL_22680 [Geotalea uraniireducens]|uniref:Cohesin domain-containing protein n=1 Tax=Geotalea uraniireducens TaxID=351604 RepID=A0ABN6VSQ0_9BACT|nr:cohesin domain-containing protein [Geotalea uraniireducens]BDV43345.1 hypothetical protein GURASL_22680 [Geotalea uraniireducens]
MKLKLILWAAALMVLWLVVPEARAQSSGSLSLVENGQANSVEFTVYANGFANVQGVQFTLSYDAAVLSNPQVTKGSFAGSAFLESNTRSSGTVTVAMIQMTALSGSGPVAFVTFDRKTTSKATVALQYMIVPANGPEESSSTSNTSEGSQGESATTTDSSSSTGSSTTGSEAATSTTGTTTPSSSGYQEYGTSTITGVETGTAASGGGAAAPGNATVPAENSQEVPGPALTEEPAQSPSPAAEGAVTNEPRPERNSASPEEHGEGKYVAYASVLDRFKAFVGERTPQALMALFQKPVSEAISQEPAICLTDGKTTAKVLVALAEGEKNAPNFALRGATLKSLKKDARHWVVEALPAAGRHDASLTVVYGAYMVDYPLTVAPPIEQPNDRKLLTNEAGFIQFIAQRGSDKSPLFDLNKDGKRDYLDDFIFTANYLVIHGSGKGHKAK